MYKKEHDYHGKDQVESLMTKLAKMVEKLMKEKNIFSLMSLLNLHLSHSPQDITYDQLVVKDMLTLP